MKAAVTTEDHGFEVVELPDPAPAADQVVIRVAACGVCGSDLKAQPFAPAGMVMGHELGGEIVAVGSAADGWKQGHEYRCAARHLVWFVSILPDRVGLALPVGKLHRHGAGRRIRRVRRCTRATRIRSPRGVADRLLGIGGTVRGGSARCAQCGDLRR